MNGDEKVSIEKADFHQRRSFLKKCREWVQRVVPGRLEKSLKEDNMERRTRIPIIWDKSEFKEVKNYHFLQERERRLEILKNSRKI